MLRKRLVMIMSLIVMIFVGPALASASTYTVQKGDTFYSIGQKFGVSMTSLKQANHRTSDMLYAGETITIPQSTITQEEKELLASLVHAEAKGEPYAGKVAVATVVLNRVDHRDFPNTIRDVIFEVAGGAYAFTPVQNGTIYGGYTEEDMRAVNEAIAFRGQGNGSLYFYNPKTSTSQWIFSREVVTTIGNHRFAK